jgi:hypothetical protein
MRHETRLAAAIIVANAAVTVAGLGAAHVFFDVPLESRIAGIQRSVWSLADSVDHDRERLKRLEAELAAQAAAALRTPAQAARQ